MITNERYNLYMGSKHMTRDEVYRVSDYVLATGYCGLQRLLKLFNRDGYNRGIYGWNYDVYTFLINGYVISITTGYRGMPGKYISSDISEAYENLVGSIYTGCKSIEDMQHKAFNLVSELVMDVIPEIRGE